MAKSSEQLLCIGDEICLYDENGNALVTEDPLDTRASVRCSPEHHQILSSEAIATRVFTIEPQQSYSERRALEQYIGNEEERECLYYEGSPEELVELSVLEAKAAKERAQNETERYRLVGNPVLYGEVIQLYNDYFKKYLTVSGKTCKSDASRLQVNLSSDIIGYFRIVPRYRIRVDGEPVRLGDTIALQCLRPEGYLNVSSHVLHSAAFDVDYYEVYTHTRIASWTMKRHRSAQSAQEKTRTKYINSSHCVRFYHKEMEGYLEAPVIQRNKPEVRLRKHIINPLDPKETKLPLAFWEIENADPSDGSRIQWKKPIRIRHAGSRSYLHIDPNNVKIDMNTRSVSFSFELLKNPRCFDGDDGTLFKLFPVSDSKRSGISFGSYVRIQHALTKCWMHAAAEEGTRLVTGAAPISFTLTPDPADPRHSSTVDSNPARYLSSYSPVAEQTKQTPSDPIVYNISGSPELHYHDCFSITLVDKGLSEAFNFANELLPQLQCFLRQERRPRGDTDSNFPVSDEEFRVITGILQSLTEFCTESKETDPALRVGLPIEYHQALLRDIGIIEAVIAMIQVPFDLEKRYKVRTSLPQDHLSKYEPPLEEPVCIERFLANNDENLVSIIALCYNLLRVFLIGKSAHHEASEVSKNQWHVLKMAGDNGIKCFLSHLSCGVGATDMMIRLLCNNSTVIDAVAAIYPEITSFLTDLTLDKSRNSIRQMVSENRSLEEDPSHGDEAASSIELLSTLCRGGGNSTDLRSSHIFNNRDYIASQIISKESCLLRTKMTDDGMHVEILLLGVDKWSKLDALFGDAQAALANYIQSLLGLIHAISLGANFRLLEDIRNCIQKDVCLKCLGDISLPFKIRARFCGLLEALYIDVPPFTKVILSDFSMTYDKLDESDNYPSGGIAIIESGTPDFFDQLKHWILVFLDDKCQQFSKNRDEVELLNAVLRLTHTQLRLGLFTNARDMKRLFRVLVLVLDGRTDARNEDHLKSISSDAARHWKERFLLTEETQPVMESKMLILEIFDLIFDLRLHVRADNKLQHSPRLVLASIFEETILSQREDILMPILKDILKYQYGPLKRIAVIIMHRIYNDSEEIFNKAQLVLLLSQPQHVFVYHGIKKRLAKLREYLTVDCLRLSDIHAIGFIVDDYIALFYGKTVDFNDELIDLEDTANQLNIYCKIFTNLKVHSTIMELLLNLNGLCQPLESLSSETAVDNEERILHMNVIKRCIKYLRELIRYDKDLQSQLVLDNVDLLIDICGIHPSIADSLFGLFDDNLHVSIRIHEKHIKRVLVFSRGIHHEYLHLLALFTKAQGKLLKKNQDIVMRLIMDDRRIYVPFSSPADLVTTKHMKYALALLDLLSICGQGDNAFGQSFARTVFSIGDISLIEQDNDAPLPLKAAMLRFLASIYLDNPDILSTISASDDKRIQMLVKAAYTDITAVLSNPTAESLDYVFNGLFVFLRPLFEYYLSVETTVDGSLYLLCPQLVDLTVELLEAVPPGDPHALAHTLSCLDSMINVAGFRGTSDPRELREKLRKAMVELTSETGSSVRPLDPINAKFQGFIRALIAHNDVKQLMQNEFKQLGSHFDLSSKESDHDVKSLIDYLSMATNVSDGDNRENYHVATLKLLEQIPLEFIRLRSEISHFDDPEQYEALEKGKTHVQNRLNRLGCTLVAQNLLSSPRRPIFEGALKLLIALLEGGNKNVQDNLEEYFYSISEERFFYSFHYRLQSGIASLKEAQQHLQRAAYKMNRQQSILSAGSNRPVSMMKRRSIENGMDKNKRHRSSLDINRIQIRKRVFGFGNDQNLNKITDESPMVYQKISNLMASETAEFGTTTEDFQAMKDTMRALQLMVEGHNVNLQMYLAKQPDNIKSFNIVQDVVEYLHTIVPICNIQNIRLIIQVLDTITELAQGCIENQLIIYAGKIINPANHILRERYTNCPSSLVNELKSKVVICLLSLLEGGIESSESIFREMAGSLDLNVVVHNMNAVYDTNIDQLDSPDAYEKLNNGFQYCILLMTLGPALDDNQKSTLDGNRAFEFFKSHTGKIEIVTDGQQEKQVSQVLFPVPEICKYLREDTKQRFLWNVKRDSPSAKIEDFVRLSDNIIYEIETHARVARNPYLSLLTEYSMWWWRASYVVTILLNILILTCSETILIGESDVHGAYCHRFKGVLRILLGIIHMVFWALSTIEFYYIELPILVNRHMAARHHQVPVSSAAHNNQPTTMSIRNNWLWSNLTRHMNVDPSFIVASLREQSFLYHIMMLCFSVMGFFIPGLYSLHLLDFAFRDRILQGVIASITLNVSSITRTGILAIIVVYVHSIVAYIFFRTEFDMTKGLHCATLTQCFVTVLSHGVRSGGGIGDILEPDAQEEPRGWRTAFEMSFFLLVVVFLLNAIFGIIFDTFGHLRDERSAIQHDMKDSSQQSSFNDMEKRDLTAMSKMTIIYGPESYVVECLKKANYSFFPVNRALCLRQIEGDESERLERLEELAQSLIQKVNALETHIEKLAEVQSRSRSNSLMLSPIAFSFTNADEYTQLLTELHEAYCRDMPDDVLQYCANFFNRRLEEQRLMLRSQQGLCFPGNEYHPLSGNAADEDNEIFNRDHLVDDSDEDNDEEDDELRDQFTAELPPTDIPLPTYNRDRRTSVSAESMAPTQGQNYVRQVISKTAHQCERIRQSVGNNFLFKDLDEEQYRDVVDAMSEKQVSVGEAVIEQGAVGDFFYIVESGTFDCFITKDSGTVKVAQYEAGGSFGELALMYNAPRAATIVASSDAVLWSLDRITFRTILMEDTSRKRKMYESFLEEVPLLKSLEPYERHKIADALDTVYFEEGDSVVVEGNIGDRFYIIESGSATVYRRNHDNVEKEVNALGRGNYFGELALLNDAPRVATVVAQSRLKCATLGKRAFTRLLGPVLEILKRNSENYHAIINQQP
ncbi:hypothetical protein BX666DRAFT_2026190 [Dichotomocladium elegans]|nr:hypothetical protein BX666DRAFT_2026190 [Dichotomocladium elegans]